MKTYTIKDNTVSFRQSNLPKTWNMVFAQLGVYVHITNDKRYPYSVQLSESEFLSCLEMMEA